MTRLFLFFLVTNFLHAAEMERTTEGQLYIDHSYMIMTSRLKSDVRKSAYRIVFGASADRAYSRHLDDPWHVREEILGLITQAEHDGDHEKIGACNKILLLFPQ